MMESAEPTRRSFFKTLAQASAGLGLAAAGCGQPKAEAEESQDKTDAASAEAGLLKTVPRKPLGSTGESIPILLMGCSQKFDPKYDKLLHRAYKDGVDYLDTALSYAAGQSHRTIAPFLKQIPDRKKIWVTSKGSVRAGNPGGIQSNIEKCLEQLETDYLDLFFMHGIDDVAVLEKDFLDAGEAMKKAGKTRFFGFSCHGGRVADLMDKAADVGRIDVIMFRYSFARYGDLKLNQAIDKCKKAGIGLIAMKTQESVPKSQEEVVQFESKNFTLHQAKLKAVWSDPRIDAAVSHMDNTTKLSENVKAAKSPIELSMNEFHQLRELARVSAPYSCQGCTQHCESQMTQPVKIADSLRFLMYHECYGDSETAHRLYDKIPQSDRGLGLDYTAATRACPQGIDIAARMQQVHRELGGVA